MKKEMKNKTTYTLVGLGNPGEEYAQTRHNTGRILVELASKDIDTKKWKLVLPDTFMNNSGTTVKGALATLMPSTLGKASIIKVAEKLVVIYDDLDLPFGSAKMSFNRSSGGHKGVESIIKALGTEKFTRIRVGISPTTPTGKIRKPQGEERVTKVILGKFKPEELAALKKLSKKINQVLETFATDGLQKAMSEFN